MFLKRKMQSILLSRLGACPLHRLWLDKKICQTLHALWVCVKESAALSSHGYGIHLGVKDGWALSPTL